MLYFERGWAQKWAHSFAVNPFVEITQVDKGQLKGADKIVAAAATRLRRGTPIPNVAPSEAALKLKQARTLDLDDDYRPEKRSPKSVASSGIPGTAGAWHSGLRE
jgi:hypothetical protein